MPGRMRAVRGATFVGDLDGSALRSLTDAGILRRFGARATVLHEGDDGNGAYVVMAGKLKASSCQADGREQLLSVHGPGDAIGLVGAIDGGVRTADVATFERSELLFVARERWFELVATHSSIAIAVMRQLTRDFRAANRRQLSLGSLDTTGRVARQLTELAEVFGEPVDDGTEITISVTHQDLANWVGASREGAGRAVATLERLGHLSNPPRGRIVVRDARALATFGD